MDYISQWVEAESPQARQLFTLKHLELFVENPNLSAVTKQFTYQLKDRANGFLNTPQQEKALELADALLFAAQHLTERCPRSRDLVQARGLMVWVNYYVKEGQNGKAEETCQKVQYLFKSQAADPLELVRCEMRLFRAYSQLGRRAEVAALLEPTIQAAEATGDQFLLAAVLTNAGASYIEGDDYIKAAEAYQRPIEFLQQVGKAGLSTLSICYRGVAESYLYLHRFNEALELAEKSRELAQLLEQTLCVAETERIIASAQFNLGHFTRALRTWDEALRLFQESNSQREAFLVNELRINCLIQLNRWAEALDLTEQLIPVARAKNWSGNLAAVIYYRAILLSQLARDGDEIEPQNCYKEAADLFAKLDMPYWVALVCLGQVGLALQTADLPAAGQALQQAEQAIEQRSVEAWFAQVRLFQARLALLNKQANVALELAKCSLQLAEQSGVLSWQYQACQLLGDIAETSNQPEQALAYYKQAIQHIEQLRGTITIELRGDFLRDKTKAYESVVRLALERGDLEVAYDYIERSKSRALTELLANQIDLQVYARSEADIAQVEKLNQLRKEYAFYQSQLHLSSKTAGGMSLATPVLQPETQTQQYRQAMKQREQQIEQLLRHLELKDASYAENFSLTRISTSNVLPSEWLKSTTLLIEYYFSGEELLALAISAQEVKVYRQLTNRARLDRELKALPTALQKIAPERALKYLANTQAMLSSLYKALFAPIAEWAAHFQELVFVPSGGLHHLPFQALYNPVTRRYLIEDWDVSYLPSASQLPFYRQRATELHQTAQPGGVVIGYSDEGKLPFVFEEVQAVASSLSGQVQTYLETQATQEVLREQRTPCQIIHLATHGQFRSDAPLFSYIELADGILLTADIFKLKLQAQLVCLSACESGLSTISRGDELAGLSRACLYAGAASLLLSLWQVEDSSTARLMEIFYRELTTSGTSRAMALRRAQLHLLQQTTEGSISGHYQHPYFWAAFCLIGEPGPL